VNYLAHIYLSGTSKGLIFGNFIADAVRGKAYENYSPEVQKGILLHRSIDSFTDAHPIFRKHSKLFFKEHRHYGRVILDVLYDHLLAKNWHNYHPEDLQTFSRSFYHMVRDFPEPLPQRMVHFFDKMEEQNWLFEYADIKGIARILMHMSRRTAFPSDFPAAVPIFQAHEAAIEADFFDFFEAIKKHISMQLNGIEKS